jgi:dihydrofolate synthase / folylpolyglutamate synthase
MTYQEAIQFLYRLRWFGTKLGLENTERLAELAGNPHHRLRFIHVAGTNGKGSTCAILESIYRQAGWRVGLFTSPHLVSFGERIQINRQPISDADIVRRVDDLRGLLTHFASEHHPTFFEVITVMAMSYFAEHQCDLVIWEAGLGGRLDATNIVTPLASVITNVQFDHQQWLGDTLAQIATEKAGIIKTRVPVLTAADIPAALEVITATARDRHAPLKIIHRHETSRPPLDQTQLPLKGEHQLLNAALAIATVRTLIAQLPVSSDSLKLGLETVSWPGRLQVETLPGGRTVILDGAHNPAGVGTLRAALQFYFPGVRPIMILGMLRDKDWATMCDLLAPMAKELVLVPVHSDRTAQPEDLRASCRQANPSAPIRIAPSLARALEESTDASTIVISGSLYLVGEAMELLQLTPEFKPNERLLNEWGSRNSP